MKSLEGAKIAAPKETAEKPLVMKRKDELCWEAMFCQAVIMIDII